MHQSSGTRCQRACWHKEKAGSEIDWTFLTSLVSQHLKISTDNLDTAEQTRSVNKIHHANSKQARLILMRRGERPSGNKEAAVLLLVQDQLLLNQSGTHVSWCHISVQILQNKPEGIKTQVRHQIEEGGTKTHSCVNLPASAWRISEI